MNRTVLIMMTCTALAAPAGVVHAQEREQQGSGNTEIMGRLLGAGVGALLGSQVGGGKGQLAAVAVGALAGAWLGGEAANRLTQTDRQGIAQTTNTALDTGQAQTWTNPDTGVTTRVSVKDSTVERAPLQAEGLQQRPWQSPPLEYVNASYVANSTSNVRSGPGTDYAVMHTVQRGERVTVVGKVQGDEWYMISDAGLGSGYVHGSLLTRTAQQPGDVSPLYAEARDAGGRQLAQERECSVIVQEITLPDGTRESRDMRACRQPDGSWVAV